MDKKTHEKMRDFVEENNLKQILICKSMNVSPSALSRILNGERDLSLADYKAFCDAVAVEYSRFL